MPGSTREAAARAGGSSGPPPASQRGASIAACGVPVVDTMGVRGGAIHSSDEYLIVDSLAERAQLSALTILRLASGATL